MPNLTLQRVPSLNASPSTIVPMTPATPSLSRRDKDWAFNVASDDGEVVVTRAATYFPLMAHEILRGRGGDDSQGAEPTVSLPSAAAVVAEDMRAPPMLLHSYKEEDAKKGPRWVLAPIESCDVDPQKYAAPAPPPEGFIRLDPSAVQGYGSDGFRGPVQSTAAPRNGMLNNGNNSSSGGGARAFTQNAALSFRGFSIGTRSGSSRHAVGENAGDEEFLTLGPEQDGTSPRRLSKDSRGGNSTNPPTPRPRRSGPADDDEEEDELRGFNGSTSSPPPPGSSRGPSRGTHTPHPSSDLSSGTTRRSSSTASPTPPPAVPLDAAAALEAMLRNRQSSNEHGGGPRPAAAAGSGTTARNEDSEKRVLKRVIVLSPPCTHRDRRLEWWGAGVIAADVIVTIAGFLLAWNERADGSTVVAFMCLIAATIVSCLAALVSKRPWLHVLAMTFAMAQVLLSVFDKAANELQLTRLAFVALEVLLVHLGLRDMMVSWID